MVPSLKQVNGVFVGFLPVCEELLSAWKPSITLKAKPVLRALIFDGVAPARRTTGEHGLTAGSPNSMPYGAEPLTKI